MKFSILNQISLYLLKGKNSKFFLFFFSPIIVIPTSQKIVICSKKIHIFAAILNHGSSMIQVIVVDDHLLFRSGLKMTLQWAYPDICVTGEADCGEALFALLPATPADIVLLDVNLPDICGVEIARRLRKEYPALKILAVTADDTPETLKAMLETGIEGFISKQNNDYDMLAGAIHAVMSGLDYFGRDISNILLGVYASKKKTTAVTSEFTGREREIIIACSNGLMGKEIANHLGISINTVNTHKKNIFQKLGINNTVEMIQYALKNGIIRP